jgi:hypothetical protein
MSFAILFIVAFLAGLIIYLINRNWVIAVLIPMALFLFSTLADQQAQDAWAFTLIFGLPLVFFASLLGAYVVQIRSADHSVEHSGEHSLVEAHNDTQPEDYLDQQADSVETKE